MFASFSLKFESLLLCPTPFARSPLPEWIPGQASMFLREWALLFREQLGAPVVLLL